MKKIFFRGFQGVRNEKIGALVLALMMAAAIGVDPAFAGDGQTDGADWGCKEFITWTDTEGSARVNEALADIIVPVGKTFETDALKVTVIDAAYDGRSAVLSWTVENKLDTAIYLLCSPLFNGQGSGAGSGMFTSDLLINPGEMIQSAQSTSLIDHERYDAQTCEILLRVTALTPTGPVVTLRFGETSNTDSIDGLIADGNVPIDEGGSLWLGSLLMREEYQSMGYADILVDAGIMVHAGAVDASFAIDIAPGAKRGVSDRSEVVFGDFTMRLVEAVKTANTVTILLDAVFDSEEAAARYDMNPVAAMQFYGSPTALYFEDGGGENYFGMNHLGNCSFGSIEREPVAQPDGTWTWRAMATSVDFLYADDTCRIVTLVPVDLENKLFEEQVITISFDANGHNPPPADAEQAEGLNERLALQVAEVLKALKETHADEMADEERLILYHILSHAVGDENVTYISAEMDWQALLSDLTACDGVDALQKILRGEYAYLNQSPPGEPSRDEILRAAEPTIAALGYGEMPLQSFLYTGPVGGGSPDLHDVMIADAFGKQQEWPDQAVVAAFDAEGKVLYLYGASASFHDVKPVAADELEKVSDFVWDLVAHSIGLAGVPVEDSVRVAENVGHQQDGSRVIKSYVLVEVGAEGMAEPDTVAVAIVVNIDLERVLQISLYQADSVEEYFLNSLF